MADGNNEKIKSCVFCNPAKHTGVHFMSDGSVVFRLFTFSDTSDVVLEYKPENKNIDKRQMFKKNDCIWEITVPSEILNSGDRYRFIIKRNGKEFRVKDPCSMFQDSFFKWSRLYDHSKFNWTDFDFLSGKTQAKISRLSSSDNNFLPVGALRILEIHIGTFTKEGTFKSAAEKLEHVAFDLGFNAIEIMPVENTYSFNWGYDGADKYAPNHTYGTPDDFKELINTAHKHNLNVIIDIVPNHLGPDIQQLSQTGPYLDGENCFGYKFNFEKDKYSRYVRDFIVGAALNFVQNYHCDGLRVDMTKFMCSDYTMKELSAELNYHCPDAFLIAEDGRDNDGRVIRPFSAAETDRNTAEHDKFIYDIKNNNVSLSGIGFDTEWDFPFHKQIAASVLGVWDCRKKDIKKFDESLSEAQYRVKYPMSHDEIGNVDGTRLISKIMVNKLNLADKICDCIPSLKCKIQAHCAHNLAQALLDGSLESMSIKKRNEFFTKNNIIDTLTLNEIKQAYFDAVKLHRLVIAKIYSIPGPKMIFQGDERADISYFKFFRKFSTGPEYYLRDKGYEPGISAFNDSKLGTVKVCSKYIHENIATENLVSDLNFLCKNNHSLEDGHIDNSFYNENADVHAIHARKMYNEIFSVSNFSNVPYLCSYGIMFPKGQWREILNTDNKRYSGEGVYLNDNKIFENYSHISIPAYGTVFFKKI